MTKQTSIYFLVLLFLASFSTNDTCAQSDPKPKAKEGPIKWYSFEEAYKLNKKKPKKMFIDVYTEWCGWCKKMDAETFADPAIAEYLTKNFYCVKLDAERKDTVIIDTVKFVNRNPGNKRGVHQLAVDLLRGKMSYPSYVFLNEKGQWIQVIQGYQPPKNFEPIMHYFGDNVYLKTKWEDYLSTFQSTRK